MNEADVGSPLLQQFYEWDLDGDGGLSLEELSLILQNLGCTNSEVASLIFSDIDADNNGVIEYDELVNWVLDNAGVAVEEQNTKSLVRDHVEAGDPTFDYLCSSTKESLLQSTSHLHELQCASENGQRLATTAIQSGHASNELFKNESLEQVLQRGDVGLVRGNWIIGLSVRMDGVLRRHQEIKKSDFVEPGQVSADSTVAISYCWLTREHPDPYGLQLQEYLGPMMRKFKKMMRPQNVCAFLDWCSLPQHPRTNEEEEQFMRGLQSVNIFYAHQLTHVWLLTKTRATRVTHIKYDDRAWPFFERAVSTLTKLSGHCLDLGCLDDNDNAIEFWDQEGWRGVRWTYANVRSRAICQRLPPLRPDQFANTLATKHVTNGGDKALLAQKYAEAFYIVMYELSELMLDHMGWGDEELSQLAIVLPDCSKITCLSLQGGQIANVAPLSVLESHCKRLRRLSLNKNLISDLMPLDLYLRFNATLQELELRDNRIVDLSSLACLQINEALERLFVDGNMISDLTAIGTILESKETVLKELHLDRNNIVNIEPILTALKVNTALQILNLSNNRIEVFDPTWPFLATDSKLSCIHMKSNSIGKLTTFGLHSSKSGSLCEINVADNPVEDLIQFVNAMLSTSQLKSVKLDLSRLAHLRTIGKDLFTALCDAIDINPLVVESLDVSSNHMLHLDPIDKALGPSSALRSVYFCNNDIRDLRPLQFALSPRVQDDEFCLSPSQLVDRTSKLRVLDLSMNSVTDLHPLCLALEKNVFLQDLNLAKNRITDITELAQSLTRNTALQKLNLAHNNIQSARPLELAFTTGIALHRLDIGDNQIPGDDLVQMGRVLSFSHDLQQLGVGSLGLKFAHGIRKSWKGKVCNQID